MANATPLQTTIYGSRYVFAGYGDRLVVCIKHTGKYAFSSIRFPALNIDERSRLAASKSVP